MAIVKLINDQKAGIEDLTITLDSLACDFLVAGYTWYNGGAPTINFSDSAGGFANTWTLATRTTSLTGANLYRTVPSFKSATHDFILDPTSSAYGVFTVVGFSGVDQVSPLILNSGGEATSAQNSMQTSGGVPSASDALVVSVGGTVDTSSPLVCSLGDTQYITQYVGGNNLAGGFVFSIQTTATSFNPVWSWPVAAEGSMRTAFYRAAVAAVGNSAQQLAQQRQVTY